MKQIVYVCLTAGSFLCCQPFTVVRAQLPQPSQWAQFVSSSENKLEVDTFRMQSFSHTCKDNWNYTVEGKVEERLFPAKETLLAEESQGLQIQFPGSVEFTPYNPDLYQEVSINILYGGKNLRNEDKMKVSIFRNGSMQDLVMPTNADPKSWEYAYQPIANGPSFIKFYTEEQQQAKGFYGLLEVFAMGSLPRCSYFTGSSCWNDTVRWSHLPAARHRTALIAGDITVDENIQCDHVHLSNSSLLINKGSCLAVRQLSVYDTGTEISGGGELSVEDELTLHYNFPQKGKWYFVSFPCDIYADELSSGFMLKDNLPNTGGNYIYVQEYDGLRRAQQNSASGNWKVLPASSGHTLLFERGKGYLIALDQKATQQEISFSISDAERIAIWQQPLSQSVTFPVKPTTGNMANFGWQLCGNPFPEALPFSVIQTTGCEKGIYVYEGGAYRYYSLSDNKTIPPYTPFFLKAVEAEASVTYNKPETVSHAVHAIRCPSAYEGSREPENRVEPMANMEIGQEQFIRLAGNRCIIESPASGCTCRIYSISGRLISSRQLPAGRNEFALNVPQGCYLFDIEIKGSGHITRKISKR